MNVSNVVAPSIFKLSKAYAMTGWGIGYGSGLAPLMKAVRAVLSQSTSCTCSIA